MPAIAVPARVVLFVAVLVAGSLAVAEERSSQRAQAPVVGCSGDGEAGAPRRAPPAL